MRRRRACSTGEPPVFVAVTAGGQLWYGQLVLCFVARYLGPEELCYVRWLTTAQMRAREEGQRPMTQRECAGPFDAYRWSKSPGSRRIGHPLAGSAHYGVVSASALRYRAPMMASIVDPRGDTDPIYRNVTDMWRFGG